MDHPLYKLFNFNFSDLNVNNINLTLSQIKLNSFNHRNLFRLCKLLFKILNISPSILKDSFIKNDNRHINYNLRNKNDFFLPQISNKYGNKTFICFLVNF